MKRSRWLRGCVGLSLVLLLVPALAQAWWNKDWTLRKQIVVDTTAKGGNIASGFGPMTLLVRLHAGNFTHFPDIKPDGADLRFIGADDKTPLPFHVERIDTKGEFALIWVQVPQIAGNSNTSSLHMYFGNGKAPAAEDRAGSYDKSNVLIWHFDDPAGVVKDATAYGNNSNGAALKSYAAGLVGYAADFDGTNYATSAATPSLAFSAEKGASLSVWVNLAKTQGDGVVAELRDANGAISLAIQGTTPLLSYQAAAGGAAAGAAPAEARAKTGLVPAAWTHLAATVSGKEMVLYVNGGEAARVPVTLTTFGGTLTVGAGAGGARPLQGVYVDELRIASVVRNADAFKAEVGSDGVGGNLVTYGNDGSADAEGGASPSYFLITLQNITSDGWAVIGVLMVLFLLSVSVMIMKALLIRSVSVGNKAFREAFVTLRTAQLAERNEDSGAREPALAGDPDTYDNSTLYSLYTVGLKEVHSRVAGASVGARRAAILSPQSIDAIRAAMHATAVREGQRLNRYMVLLTLAISGGPFLGLLGTVVGVMITFAAIAHTGTVDVGAIAPGTAAALAATVAGLGVAIPALFGYNYLSTQVREITSEDDTFVDEFVTRMAEQYS